jgi:hypothetical protein
MLHGMKKKEGASLAHDACPCRGDIFVVGWYQWSSNKLGEANVLTKDFHFLLTIGRST